MKKRGRSIRGLVGRISGVALGEHRMGVSLLGDYPGADRLLVASAASEAPFSEVTLVDGMTGGETGDTAAKGLKAGFSLGAGLVGFTERRTVRPLAK